MKPTNRKEFIKTTALLGLGAITLGTHTHAADSAFHQHSLQPAITPVDGHFELPPLGYDYKSLEPFIDATTMEIHHGKHHQAYVNKLNEAINKEPTLAKKSLEELLMTLSSLPATVKTAVRNHGGGHWNHSFFWKMLKTGTRPGQEFNRMAAQSFGSFETLQSTFDKVSMGVFGSGWAWIILQNGQLKISTSPNQDNPLMDSAKVPERMPKVILGIDLWEHAYYLKHQNRRADYLAAFWNVVNWDEVENRLKS